MPYAPSDGVELFYESAGEGETVAFIGTAGLGAWQWSWQNDRIAGPFRTIVWDLRGTGRSDSSTGSVTVDMFADDLESVLRATDTRRVHLIGAGLGGMVAVAYTNRFDRARSLTLIGTAANGDALNESALDKLYPGTHDRDSLRESLEMAFSSDFLTKQSAIVDQICKWRLSDDARGSDLSTQRTAMTEFEADSLYEYTLPTLVLHGEEDPIISLSAGRSLANSLPAGTFEPVEGKHLCHIEHGQAVSDRILDFLDTQTKNGSG